MGHNPILHLDTNNGKGTVLLLLLVEMVGCGFCVSDVFINKVFNCYILYLCYF